MTIKRMREKRPLTEDAVSRSLCIAAVRLGLRTPQTAEEVAAFEEQFAADIQTANARSPHLSKVTERARQLRTSGTDLQPAELVESSESRLQMAARNGGEVSPEIEERMNEALAQARSKRTTGDGG
jgi:hypothetical protein